MLLRPKLGKPKFVEEAGAKEPHCPALHWRRAQPWYAFAAFPVYA